MLSEERDLIFTSVLYCFALFFWPTSLSAKFQTHKFVSVSQVSPCHLLTLSPTVYSSVLPGLQNARQLNYNGETGFGKGKAGKWAVIQSTLQIKWQYILKHLIDITWLVFILNTNNPTVCRHVFFRLNYVKFFVLLKFINFSQYIILKISFSVLFCADPVRPGGFCAFTP